MPNPKPRRLKPAPPTPEIKTILSDFVVEFTSAWNNTPRFSKVKPSARTLTRHVDTPFETS